MANNTIKLSVYGIPPVELELLAGATITPGMLVSRTTTGTVIPHGAATPGTFASPKLIAVENLMEGKAITDDYIAGEKVYIIAARPGDQMWLWLELGAAASVIGAQYVSNGAGMLEPVGATPYDGTIVGTALEIVEPLVVPVGAKRIRIEIA